MAILLNLVKSNGRIHSTEGVTSTHVASRSPDGRYTAINQEAVSHFKLSTAPRQVVIFVVCPMRSGSF